MDELTKRIALAKKDNAELDKLITDYMPFIKKTISGFNDLEYDDRVSLAMLTFMICVRQYSEERGNFIAYVTVCIKNRLVDESKRQRQHIKNTVHTEDDSCLADDGMIDKDMEREMLSEEIKLFKSALSAFDISFFELAKICPKQDRSRRQCISYSKYVTENNKLLKHFRKTKRLPQSELSEFFKVSMKTLEKHRKYIISIILILSGEYPAIRTFLPEFKEVE